MEGKPLEQQSKRFLDKNPVDVLLVEEGQQGKGRNDLLAQLQDTPHLPTCLAICGPSQWMLSKQQSLRRKRRRKALEKRGYTCLEWVLDNQLLGGALDQECLIDVFLLNTNHRDLPSHPLPQGLPSRQMSNLLEPFALVPFRERAPPGSISWNDTPYKMGPCLISGRVGNNLIYEPSGCMPNDVSSWVATERPKSTGKCVRRLLTDELCRAKGVPKEWVRKGSKLPKEAVINSTPLHVWTVLCDSLSSWLRHDTREHSPKRPKVLFDSRPSPVGESCQPDEPARSQEPWTYQMPNLEKGGLWYQERVSNLRVAVRHLPNPASLIEEGLEMLEIHRNNYTEAGPKYLQLLWWEFPPEHRNDIRLGSSMRFMVDPGTDPVDNSPLTEEQQEVVIKFIEELKELGVLRKATVPLRRTCPIFVVPKPGQPGQWRCIADMKRGGQNACCSQDPIYLPSCHDILPQLYTGGWSAVADASKYFHNYTTVPQERDLIGIIHPVTGEALWYVGLPMGSVNSPSIACRCGEGVLRLLREEMPVFTATSYRENTWRTALNEGEYDSTICHGYAYFQDNGRPIAQVYGYVDDFLIHASTYDDCVVALNGFMDMVIRVGLICQPLKTEPPARVQKYCGFLYDTEKSPSLRIPPSKISRCLASARFLLGRSRDLALSRLSLAVVTGVLQSIVEATPRHMGQTHLRSLYDDLHRWEEVSHLEGANKYYTSVDLSDASRAALHWWMDHLSSSTGRCNGRLFHGQGLVMKWGDGSGTGTGGTTEFYPITKNQEPNPNIELWMGIWQGGAVTTSSNWKEMRTIKQALLHELPKARVQGCTVFYITDNLVSYYVINNGSSRSAGLHTLVMEILAIAEDLGCRLEVVHAPGTLMIEQGTDGQSRGLWLAPQRRPSNINQSLFNPVRFTPTLQIWVCEFLNIDPLQCQHLELTNPRVVYQGQHKVTFWTPPPECARQVIVSFLHMWVQTPFDTEAIFIVPRILQKQWGRISRYVEEKGVFLSNLLPAPYAFSSHLPFVLLHIAPHLSSLNNKRLERATHAKPNNWHKRQADAVRGLS